jgi:hypothetical protein
VYHNLLSIQSRVLPEKLIVVHLVKSFPAFYGTCATLFNMLDLYSKVLLAPCPIPKLEDYLLLAVSDCLFNIYAAVLHIWKLSPPSAT